MATGPRIRNPGVRVTPGTVVTPEVVGPTPGLVERFASKGNLFSAGRPGQPVVRPADLFACRIELRNLSVVPGVPPRVVKQGTGAAYIILHFPPQAITEQAFFQAAQDDFDNPQDSPESRHPHPDAEEKPDFEPGRDDLAAPPVRARIAGESRLAFRVPDGFEAPYSLAGLLDACSRLSPHVAPNARAPSRRSPALASDRLFLSSALRRLAPWQRVALTSHAVRSLSVGGVAQDTATLQLRQSASAALRPIDTGLAPRVPELLARPPGPQPAAPGATQTAIEMPWRLILSPHAGERWLHAADPVTSPATGRTELWHTRLASGGEEPAGGEDPKTVRAIWALTGEGIEQSKPMQGTWPGTDDLPKPDTKPFRTALDDFDRFQIAHLSSNFSVRGYTPEPVEAELLMLTALGGWLESRGAWDPPGLSVEEWSHRATMGRDHYARVVYRGFLFPFGHRVSLVKVTERKFHNGALGPDRIGITGWRAGRPVLGTVPGKPVIEQTEGNTAYLRQRMFIVVRERERTFDDPLYQDLRNKTGEVRYFNQFPFSRVRLLTQTTPDLDDPAAPASSVDDRGQLMFWPHVGGQPFRFQCLATDLDGRRIAFDLPMIFMDNTLACPRSFNQSTRRLKADFPNAEIYADIARRAHDASGDKRVAALRRQRVALAPSIKPGDTAVEVETLTFGAEAEMGHEALRAASRDLSRPMFFPCVREVSGRVGALSVLGGSDGTNRLTWNARYLDRGFGGNAGEVFADVADDPQMARLDFSSQGDRSGGFVQPNLKPAALSRFAGPVMGDVGKFIDGEVPLGGGFPVSPGDLPLPLLFGCIPLGEIVKAVANLVDRPERIPKFVSEAGSQLENFVNALARLHGALEDLAGQPSRIAGAGIAAAKATLADQVAQGQAYAAAQMQPVESAVTELNQAIAAVAVELTAISDRTLADGAVNVPLGQLPGAVSTARARLAALAAAANASPGGVSLPSGLRQSILTLASKLDPLLVDVAALPTLVAQARALFDAVEAIVGDPAGFGALLADAGLLQTRLGAIADAIPPLKVSIGSLGLFAGAPRKALLGALEVVEAVVSGSGLAQAIQALTGDELTVRFDWNPEISSWWLPSANPGTDDPIFRANDPRGFLVSAQASVKKSGSPGPKMGVTCGLKHFDLVLVAPASFLELNFDRILFSVDSAAKMDVDVLLSDIKFVGPLSFVETLRDLIPLDGFSDPPYLDISTKGIDAGFSVGLPSVAVGVLNLSNLSLGAGFTVPFIGQPLSVRFNFCTREQPFNLTVSMFGGGGFFGVTIDPRGVQVLEASFEFGASISINLGVASGGVWVMAGIYFRMEQDAASLTGYFRLGGRVDVLGLITASIELYLELMYEFQSGKCVGRAQLTIEISVFIFSGSVTVRCERKFAGANGDPTLRDMLGLRPELPLDQELALIGDDTVYAWREYCEAFA
jgi:hypothetical protein